MWSFKVPTSSWTLTPKTKAVVSATWKRKLHFLMENMQNALERSLWTSLPHLWTWLKCLTTYNMKSLSCIKLQQHPSCRVSWTVCRSWGFSQYWGHLPWSLHLCLGQPTAVSSSFPNWLARTQFRWRPTDANPENQLRIASSSLPCDIKRFAKEKQIQQAHWGWCDICVQ